MQNLFDFLKRYSFVILFVFLEVISLVLISRSSFYQSSRMVSWGNAIAGKWYGDWASLSDYFGLRVQNQHLAEENARLRAQLESSYISYNSLEFEVNDTTYKQQYTYTEANVIKNSWNKHNNYLMINKGSAQGIHNDMAAISPQGIVGIVVNTTKNFATIMPVLHSDSRNSVKIQRTGSNGTLIWEGGDYRYAYVIDIPTTHKLFKGDTIVTSGLANDFPEGIAVGYIEALYSVSGSGFYKVKIRLATEFNNLGHIYIINNRFKEEQDALMNATKQSTENQ